MVGADDAKRTPKWTLPEAGRPKGTSDATPSMSSPHLPRHRSWRSRCMYILCTPSSRVMSHHHPLADFLQRSPSAAQGRSGSQWATEASAGLPGDGPARRACGLVGKALRHCAPAPFVWPQASPVSCAHTTRQSRPRVSPNVSPLSVLPAHLRLACGSDIEHKTTPNRAWGKVARAEFVGPIDGSATYLVGLIGLRGS